MTPTTSLKTFKAQAVQLQHAEIDAKLGRRPIQRLPLELLADTMRFACMDVFDLIALSHVNQQFHNAALTMSDMWAEISSRMSLQILELCLKRSGGANLHIRFDEMHNLFDDEDFKLHVHRKSLSRASQFIFFLDEIAQRLPQWKEIKFNMPPAYTFSEDSFAHYKALSNRFLHPFHVPHLVALSISHFGNQPYVFDKDRSDPENRKAAHFYRLWTAPKLRSLTFTGIAPAPIAGASIETLSLDLLSRRLVAGAEAMRDLCTFLQETPSLQKFELWTDSSMLAHMGQTPPDFPIITLDKLQELTFNVIHSSPDLIEHFPLSSFVDCLRLPTLSSLEIKLAMRNAKHQNVTVLVSSFIPRLVHPSSLANLSLFIYDPFRMSSTISVALDEFPSLKTLTLGVHGRLLLNSARTILHPNSKESGGASSLERINMLACTSGAEDFLARVLGELREGDGDLRRLKKVVVKGCASAKETQLLEFIPLEKLDFEGVCTAGQGIKCWTGYGYYCGGDLEPDSDDE